MASLDSARAKLRRADEHLECLQSAMERLLHPKRYEITEQTDTKSGERFYELLDPPDLPAEWSLLIGDCVSNARSAIDHLAWQIASRNTAKAAKAASKSRPRPPKDTEFPIFVDISDSDTAKKLERKLGYFLVEDEGLIRDEQPYLRGDLAHAQPLWLLHELRNADTHREIHTMLMSVHFPDRPLHTATIGEHGLKLWVSPDYDMEIPSLETIALGEGDTVKTTLKVKANFAPNVTFDQRGADFHGQEVLPVLRACRDEVERVLGLF